MEQNKIKKVQQCGFSEFFKTNKYNMFVLDLSNCTLIECIKKMCDIKSRSHPKIKQNYKMLINKLTNKKTPCHQKNIRIIAYY